MKGTTKELIRLVQSYPRASYDVIAAHGRTVTRAGSTDDAEALLPVFLHSDGTSRFARDYLLQPITVLGNESIARTLLEQCCDQHGLLPDMPAELLHCFGYHGLQETLPMLWSYARDVGEYRTDNSYSASKAAVEGLLHLDCAEIRDEIEHAVHECVGLNLFPEFLPALAYKTGNAELLETIWEIGQTASVDCNGGVLLGLAMYGNAGRDHFERAMWSPDLYPWDTGTGSVFALFDGMCVQRLSVADVYDEWLRRRAAGDDSQHGLLLVKNLLMARLHVTHTGLRFAPYPPDTCVQLHDRLFSWSTPHEDDSLVAHARKALESVPLGEERVQEVEGLATQLLIRSEAELLLKELGTRVAANSEDQS